MKQDVGRGITFKGSARLPRLQGVFDDGKIAQDLRSITSH